MRGKSDVVRTLSCMAENSKGKIIKEKKSANWEYNSIYVREHKKIEKRYVF